MDNRFILLDENNKLVTMTGPPPPKGYKNYIAYANSSDGGNNLLLNSGVSVTNSEYVTQTYAMSQRMVAGQTYTLQIWGQLGEGKSKFQSYLNDGKGINFLITIEKVSEGYYVGTFQGIEGVGYTEDKLLIYAIPNTSVANSTIDKIKLELGSTPTPWQPHSSEILDFAPMGWGENLLKNSDFSNGLTHWTGQNGGGDFDESGAILISNGSSVYQSTDVGVGVKTTASIKAKGTGRIQVRWGNSITSYQQVSEEYKTYVFNIPMEGNRNLIVEAGTDSEIMVERVKLEKGSTATPWQPHSSEILDHQYIGLYQGLEPVDYKGNRVRNSNFENGDYWAPALLNLRIANNSAYLTYSNNTDNIAHPNMAQWNVGITKAGDKYYVSFEVYENNNTALSFFQTGGNYTPTIPRGFNGKLSLVFTPTTNADVIFFNARINPNEIIDCKIKNVYLVNLTEEYGEGNEPTKEYMDSLPWTPAPEDILAKINNPSNYRWIKLDNFIAEETFKQGEPLYISALASYGDEDFTTLRGSIISPIDGTFRVYHTSNRSRFGSIIIDTRDYSGLLEPYKPSVYDEVLEYEEVIRAEGEVLSWAHKALDTIQDSRLLRTIPIEYIESYEKIFNIIPNSSIESIEFRRQRVINRLSMKPPFTYEFLVERLDDIVGKGQYSLEYDKDNFTLFVESSAENQQWASELSITINSIKPANIVYVQVPAIFSSLLMSSQTSYIQSYANYIAGQWIVGEKDIISYQEREFLNMALQKTMREAMIEDTLAQVGENVITDFYLNNSVALPSNSTVDKATNRLITTCEVTTDSGVTNITSIALRNASGQILEQFSTSVPVVEGVTLKHYLSLEEGVK